MVKGAGGCDEDSHEGAGDATVAWTADEGRDSASGKVVKPGGAMTGCLGHGRS